MWKIPNPKTGMNVRIPAINHSMIINRYIKPFVKCLQYQNGFVNAKYLSTAIRNATQPELSPKNRHRIRQKQNGHVWFFSTMWVIVIWVSIPSNPTNSKVIRHLLGVNIINEKGEEELIVSFYLSVPCAIIKWDLGDCVKDFQFLRHFFLSKFSSKTHIFN